MLQGPAEEEGVSEEQSKAWADCALRVGEDTLMVVGSGRRRAAPPQVSWRATTKAGLEVVCERGPQGGQGEEKDSNEREMSI